MVNVIADLSSSIDAFIHEEQLQFSQEAVLDMQQLGRYIRTQKHLWEALFNKPIQSLEVHTVHMGNPQVALIAVPPGGGIPIHRHGPKVFGVSGLLAGDLVEVAYEVEHGRIQERRFTRLSIYKGITYQAPEYHHAVANVERNEPALIVECWLPRLEFTPLRLSGRSIYQVAA